MRHLFALVIIILLIYLGYMFFSNTATVQQTKQSERLEQEGLGDLKDEVSDGAQGAIIDLHNSIQNILESARNAVRGNHQTTFNE